MSIRTGIARIKSKLQLRSEHFIFKREWRRLLLKPEKKICILYLLHATSESDIISLNTLCKSDWTGLKTALILIMHEDSDITGFSAINFPPDTKLIKFKELPSLCQLLRLMDKGSDFVVLTSSQLVFHPLWMQKAMDLPSKVYKNENLFTGGFSSFNPNDFKLLKTITENVNNQYSVKDGFSFHACFYPRFIIEKLLKKHSDGLSESLFFDYFRTRNYNFAFSYNSYASVHSYDSCCIYDQFQAQPNNLSFAAHRINDGWNVDDVMSLPSFKKLVIQINYGGLGDNLFMSHLPRIAKETGIYKQVYISDRSIYRHPDYKKLIWDSHPFVDGYTHERGYHIEFLKFDTKKLNILDHIMHLHGLDDGTLFHEPELYFKPPIIPELADKIIFDPNYVSDAGEKINQKRIDAYFKENSISIDYQMQKRDKSVPITSFSQWLVSKSLEDFCSIILSCRELYCFASGTATLAASLGKKAHVFYAEGFNPQFLHSKNNVYIKL